MWSIIISFCVVVLPSIGAFMVGMIVMNGLMKESVRYTIMGCAIKPEELPAGNYAVLLVYDADISYRRLVVERKNCRPWTVKCFYLVLDSGKRLPITHFTVSRDGEIW